METTLLNDALQERCVDAIVNAHGLECSDDITYSFGFYVDAFCLPEPRKFHVTISIEEVNDLEHIRNIGLNGAIMNREGTAPEFLFAGRDAEDNRVLVPCKANKESFPSDVEWEFRR